MHLLHRWAIPITTHRNRIKEGLMYKGKWELTENDRKRLSIRWYDLELHVSEEVAALTWHRGIICYNEQPIQHPDVVNVIDVFGYYSEDAQDEEKEIYE